MVRAKDDFQGQPVTKLTIRLPLIELQDARKRYARAKNKGFMGNFSMWVRQLIRDAR